MRNLTCLSKSGCLTKAPFGKNRVHRLQYLHEPKCCLHPCYLLTNRDAQGTVFHPSRQQLSFQRPKNKNKINDFQISKAAPLEFIFPGQFRGQCCGHFRGQSRDNFIDNFMDNFVDNVKDTFWTILGQFHTIIVLEQILT